MPWLICGSCYTMVTVEDGQPCSRCGGAIQPTPEARLRQFVANGVDPANKGVRIRDAQAAVTRVLDKLAQQSRFIDWVISLDDSGHQETDSETLGRIFEVARTTLED